MSCDDDDDDDDDTMHEHSTRLVMQARMNRFIFDPKPTFCCTYGTKYYDEER